MKTKPSKNVRKPRRPSVPTPKPNQTLKFLATTDFSDASLPGVRYTVALAKKLGAAVDLIHVVEPSSWLSELGSVGPAREESAVVARAQAKMAALAKSESKSALPVAGSVRTGKPFHEITVAARQEGANLIVVATHGRTGVEHALLGSTAERVLHHATSPVLTIPTAKAPARVGRAPAFKLKKILVPIDFSSISQDALPWATFLAERFASELILLHVVEKFPIDYLLGRELMHQTIVPLMKQAEADLAEMAARLRKTARVKISVTVREGSPFEEIRLAAKASNADLIVLTTHGYTGLKHVWLGSVAERVIRHAHCPVLTVRSLSRTSLA